MIFSQVPRRRATIGQYQPVEHLQLNVRYKLKSGHCSFAGNWQARTQSRNSNLKFFDFSGIDNGGFSIVSNTHARVAYEENRSFGIASDFYVAEMEAARAQRNFLGREFFSVPALYRAVSKYGTSVGTALRVFALIYILHMVTTLALGSPSDTVSMTSISETALRSFRVLLSQPIEVKSVTPSSAQSWLDLAFRMLGLIQVAMVVLAFRSRIKGLDRVD